MDKSSAGTAGIFPDKIVSLAVPSAIGRLSGIPHRMRYEKFNHGAVCRAAIYGKRAVRIHPHRIYHRIIEETIRTGIPVPHIIAS